MANVNHNSPDFTTGRGRSSGRSITWTPALARSLRRAHKAAVASGAEQFQWSDSMDAAPYDFVTAYAGYLLEYLAGLFQLPELKPERREVQS